MSVFDEATAARPAGTGRYEVRPDERFAHGGAGQRHPGRGERRGDGGDGAAGRARQLAASVPVATSAHFLRVPLLEPAEVEVTWLKQGRTAATARAALVQDARSFSTRP